MSCSRQPREDPVAYLQLLELWQIEDAVLYLWKELAMLVPILEHGIHEYASTYEFLPGPR